MQVQARLPELVSLCVDYAPLTNQQLEEWREDVANYLDEGGCLGWGWGGGVVRVCGCLLRPLCGPAVRSGSPRLFCLRGCPTVILAARAALCACAAAYSVHPL